MEWIIFVDAIYEGPLRKYWDRMKRWASEIGWRIMKAPSSRMLCECAIYKKRGHQIQRVRDAMAMRVDRALTLVLAQGWAVSWRAVRRRLNKEADRVATGGVMWAGVVNEQGGSGEWACSWCDPQ